MCIDPRMSKVWQDAIVRKKEHEKLMAVVMKRKKSPYKFVLKKKLGGKSEESAE